MVVHQYVRTNHYHQQWAIYHNCCTVVAVARIEWTSDHSVFSDREEREKREINQIQQVTAKMKQQSHEKQFLEIFSWCFFF